jgi:predicted transcriptional regulator
MAMAFLGKRNDMNSQALFLSIAPKFAARILLRLKTVELRRVRPKVKKGDTILLYASSPEKKLYAMAVVEEVTFASPEILWSDVKNEAGITPKEFHGYFDGADIGYAIWFRDLEELPEPVELSKLRVLWPGFHPPQIYRYLSHKEFLDLMDHVFYATDCNLDDRKIGWT